MNHQLKIIRFIILACLVAMVLNIGSMITMSKIYGGKLVFAQIYFAILPGTLIASFLLGYWMKSKGWMWGIVIPIVSLILASVYHQDRIESTILIYVCQIIPAALVGELGNRLAIQKLKQ